MTGHPIVVFTDGAAKGNPGPGGWAWAVPGGPQGSGHDPATTNQRMEVRAAFEAVRALPGPLVVVSDSTYVVNCFKNSWWRGWRARGWLNSAKKPVANRDLWEPLIDLVDGLAVAASHDPSLVGPPPPVFDGEEQGTLFGG